MSKHFVRVRKFELREGEEVWQFVDAMWQAVQTNRITLAGGSLDAWLKGIYEDYVIVEDFNTGRLFKTPFTRAEDGEIAFGEAVEVRMEFVPVPVATADGEGDSGVAKARPEEIVEFKKRSNWANLFPHRLRVE